MEDIWLLSYLVLWVVVLVETLLLFAIMRQVGLIHMRLGPVGARMGNSGPDIGEHAPEVQAETLNGELISLGTPAERLTLLVFISPGCTSCDELMPGVLTVNRSEHSTTDVILVSDIPDETVNREFIQRHRLNRIKFIVSPEITEKYRIGGSPYAVLIDKNGIVQTKGLVNHLEHLESLFNAYDEGFPSYDNKINTSSNQEVYKLELNA